VEGNELLVRFINECLYITLNLLLWQPQSLHYRRIW